MFSKILHTAITKDEVQASINKERVTIDKRYTFNKEKVTKQVSLIINLFTPGH